jgi:hypothetical protein
MDIDVIGCLGSAGVVDFLRAGVELFIHHIQTFGGIRAARF